jgi:hypothetical protein
MPEHCFGDGNYHWRPNLWLVNFPELNKDNGEQARDVRDYSLGDFALHFPYLRDSDSLEFPAVMKPT